MTAYDAVAVIDEGSECHLAVSRSSLSFGANNHKLGYPLSRGEQNLLREIATRSLTLLTALMAATVAVAQQPVQPATEPTSDEHRISTPAQEGWRPILRGQLPNGLRYVILPRSAAEPGIALRMRVNRGFLAEQRPGERGLAHLIEHIAFHSPTRSAPDQLRRFYHIGFPLTLPEPAGGTTIWRETDYHVISRTTQSSDIHALLGLYREVASELLFPSQIVDEQRDTVMREMADKRLGNDIHANLVAAIAPGSPNDVIDAQNSDDVPTASIETIRALYRRLYRPENTTIMIVGDVNPREIEGMIVAGFGDWRGEGPTPERLVIPTFDRDRIAPISHSASRYARDSATISFTMPFDPVKPRVIQAEADLLDMLMMRAITNRLAAGRGAHPPGSYGSFIENGDNNFRMSIMWDEFVPGRWREAVANLARTACDMRLNGFSETEWEAARQGLLQELVRRAGRTHEASNFELALQLANAVTLERELFSPSELLVFAKEWLPRVDASEGRNWWLRQKAAGVEHLRVNAPELALESDASSTIRTVVNDALQEKACRIEPYVPSSVFD